MLEYFQKNPQAMQQIAGPIFEDKVIDFILEVAKVTDVKVDTESLYQVADEKGETEKSATKKSRRKSQQPKSRQRKKSTAKKSAAKKPVAKKQVSKSRPPRSKLEAA